MILNPLRLAAGIAVFAAGLAAPVAAQQTTVGLFLDDPRAYPGYTLFSPQTSTSSYLIDNRGLLVHSWQGASTPGLGAYLLENAHLLRTEKVSSAIFNAGGSGGKVRELDWDGLLLWDFTYATSLHQQHHDVERLPNGNTLLIAWELKSRAEALTAGRAPALVTAQGLWPDTIVEVQPTGPTSGTVVWEWHAWDHLIQDADATKGNYGTVATHAELIDLNFSAGSNADWIHLNSIDYNPLFDQILLSSHAFSEIWVIDHGTTTQQAAGHTGGARGRGGDLLYRWGNPQAYRAGAAADRKLFLQHDAQWTRPGDPGAGNITIFNNGQGRPGGNYSSVEELTPPVDASGSYSLVPGAPFGPASATWTYTAANLSDFYSMNIGGAQRLANGNTLICDGTQGTFFEVTPAGETVWKYVNPVVSTGPLRQGDPITPGAGNLVFKIRRYDASLPGLMGRDLTPGFPVEGNPLIVYEALRSAVADPSAPLGNALPLDPARDLHTTATASPIIIAGDGAPGSPPLVFYGIRNATYLRASRQGSDVVLEFHY